MERKYYTGTSREKIEEIVEKCRWKANYQYTYNRTNLLVVVRCIWYMLKKQEPDDAIKAFKAMENSVSIETEALKEWRKDPDRYAVMELVYHRASQEDIIEKLDLTYDRLQELYPTDEELEAYRPVFTEEDLSDEQLEEAYQKMIREKK